MYQSNHLTNRSQLVRNSINRPAWRRGLHLSALALVVAWLALSPQAGAVCQEGCDLSKNTFLGDDAFISNTGTSYNVAIGFEALMKSDYNSENTAVGAYALYSDSGLLGGNRNTATGAYALYSNSGLSKGSYGSWNTATGYDALYSNTDGYYNMANGSYALYSNTTAYNNTANGSYALYSNTTANNNTADGSGALRSNTTGYQNTATGVSALGSNVTGNRNVAEGVSALWTNKFGDFNTAVGFQALYQNSGSNNVALGFNAGTNLTTGSGNVCIGYSVLGVAGESNTTRISNIYYSVASGRPVYINSDGKIGTLVSSRRFKEQIKPMDKASEAILALKPVSFQYRKEIEPNGGIMFGLIAEDVEKADPDLVTRNDKGEPETVRYEAVNAMLLNEFLKEHRKVDDLTATVNELKTAVAGEKELETTVAQLLATIKEQAAQIQKVSAKLAASGPVAPELVNR